MNRYGSARLVGLGVPLLALLPCCREPATKAPPTTPSATAGHAFSAVELARSFGLRPRSPVPDGVPIRVTDAANRSPVADALVVSVDEGHFIATFGFAEGTEPDARAQLQKLGTAYVTDSEGRTRIAPANRECSVFAWHDGRFGRIALEVFDTSDHVIALANRDLVVEVVDADRRPQAGVPLELGSCAIDVGDPGAWRGVTGPDGRAVISAIELERDLHPTCGRRAVVKLGYPARALAVRPIDAPRLEPVRLSIRECGSVEVELQDAEGNPIDEPAELEVGGQELLEPIGLEREPRIADFRPRFGFDSTTGRFVIPRVEIGLQLQFDVRETSYEFDTRRVAGPVKAGERVRVELRARQEEPARVRGRAVDANGAAMRSVELEAIVMSGDRSGSSRTNIVTRDDGEFRFAVGSRFAGEAPVLELLLRDRERIAAVGAVALEIAKEDRRLDVGEVKLEPTTLHVHGHVVDDTGAPVLDATVLVVKRENKQSWLNGDERPRSDVNGEFDVWLVRPEWELAVAAVARGFDDSDFVPLEAGGDDVRIVLPRQGTFEASVRLGEEIEPNPVDLAWRPASESPTAAWKSESMNRLFRFPFGGIRLVGRQSPGVYDFAVFFWNPGSSEPRIVREIDHVEINGRRCVRDPRLLDIDLRDELHAHAFEIVDSRGSALDGRVSYLDRDGLQFAHDEFCGGRYEIVRSTESTCRLMFASPGFRPATRVATEPFTRIVLPRGIPIRVRLDPGFVLPAARSLHLYVGVSELPRPPGDNPWEVQVEDEQALVRTKEVRPGDYVAFTLAEPGDWPVLFSVSAADRLDPLDSASRGDENESRTCVPCVKHAPVIHVLDRSEEQLFTVAPSAEDLAEAIATPPAGR